MVTSSLVVTEEAIQEPFLSIIRRLVRIRLEVHVIHLLLILSVFILWVFKLHHLPNSKSPIIIVLICSCLR